MRLNKDDWKTLRKLAKEKNGKPSSVYARMHIALSKKKGVHLSLEDIEDVFTDDAVHTALWFAITEALK